MATRAKATPVVEPQWPNCTVCARPISPEDGWLSIDDYAIYEREEAVAEWEETHGKSLESGFKIYTGEDILQHPDPVPWVWSHTGCDVGSADGYAVQAGRLDNPVKALHWTLHITGKSWVSSTNWREIMRQLYLEGKDR